MCGGFSIFTEYKRLEKRFGVNALAMFSPRYNARPAQHLPVILNTDPSEIRPILWGMSAPWSKSQLIINTRKESLATKPFFRKAFDEQRCLILADGFYEWAKTGKTKQPYRFELISGEPFAFAGIWKENPNTKEPSFTIITVEPNKIVAQVHDRMPAILAAQDEKNWLNPDLGEDELLSMLSPFPTAAMRSYPVSRDINSPANDSSSLLAHATSK